MTAARSAGGRAAQAGWAARARAIAASTSAGVLTVISPTGSPVAGLARPSRRCPSGEGGKVSTMAMATLLGPAVRLKHVLVLSLTHRRPLADAGQRVLRAAAPPAQSFDPPGQPGRQVRGHLVRTAAGRRAVGPSLQDHVERAVAGTVLADVVHHRPELIRRHGLAQAVAGMGGHHPVPAGRAPDRP